MLSYPDRGRALAGGADRGALDAEDGAGDVERLVDLGGRHVDMRDRPKTGRVPEVAAEAQALLDAGLLERAGVHRRRIDLERDDVRDDPCRVDAHARDLRESLCETLG